MPNKKAKKSIEGRKVKWSAIPWNGCVNYLSSPWRCKAVEIIDRYTLCSSCSVQLTGEDGRPVSGPTLGYSCIWCCVCRVCEADKHPDRGLVRFFVRPLTKCGQSGKRGRKGGSRR